jgi:hypothetical protein
MDNTKAIKSLDNLKVGDTACVVKQHRGEYYPTKVFVVKVTKTLIEVRFPELYTDVYLKSDSLPVDHQESDLLNRLEVWDDDRIEILNSLNEENKKRRYLEEAFNLKKEIECVLRKEITEKNMSGETLEKQIDINSKLNDILDILDQLKEK